jgi:hypothetical protein
VITPIEIAPAAPPADLPLAATPPIPGGPIRPFRREDIPAVVAMRQQAFRRSAQRSTAELTAYMTRVFFDHPWQDLPLHSLVHLDAAGEVDGFVGLTPRRIRFRQRTLMMAVPSQLMVRPGSSPGAGVRLARSILDGPQDFTLSDAANDVARRIWARVGGRTSIIPSLFWTLPLRPARVGLGRWGSSLPARAAAFVARPFIAARDRKPPELPGIQGAPVVTESLHPAWHFPLIGELLTKWDLAPLYDLAGLTWLLADANSRTERGPLIGRFVRDPKGAPIGWYFFHANRGGIGEVAQLGARPGELGRVLAPLVAEAHQLGVVALRGRLDAGIMDALAGTAVTFTRDGPWTLTHARDPELMAAITEGTGFLTRLDAEWSLNF